MQRKDSIVLAMLSTSQSLAVKMLANELERADGILELTEELRDVQTLWGEQLLAGVRLLHVAEEVASQRVTETFMQEVVRPLEQLASVTWSDVTQHPEESREALQPWSSAARSIAHEFCRSHPSLDDYLQSQRWLSSLFFTTVSHATMPKGTSFRGETDAFMVSQRISTWFTRTYRGAELHDWPSYCMLHRCCFTVEREAYYRFDLPSANAPLAGSFLLNLREKLDRRWFATASATR